MDEHIENMREMVDSVYRLESRRVFAMLIRLLGDFDLAEEALHDSASWQIVPTVVNKMMQDKDPKKSENVMAALLQMKKIDIKVLEQAYAKE